MNQDKLLKEIRENFDYALEYWADIREQGQIDMRYISGDPWDPKERKMRETEGQKRPCLTFDELGQFCNAAINDVRMNKRAVAVVPKGSGSDDKSAELRGNLMRNIEYESNAQSAYTRAFEDAVQRSYGWAKVAKRYVSPESFDQELKVSRVANPDSILSDPQAKEADCSDMKWLFEIDRMRKEDFKAMYPDAAIQEFSSEHITAAPKWIGADDVQVASYWCVHNKKRTLYMFENEQGERLQMFSDELKDRGLEVKGGDLVAGGADGLPVAVARVINKRTSETPGVVQYIVSGVEILDEIPWDGDCIPYAPCWGKELFVDSGSGSKRMLLSLVRLARDPYMLYCYYRSTEAEIIGQTPKTPYIGYEGQFENHEADWENVNRAPIPYLQVKATTEATGTAILPLPQRTTYEPAIQALEVGAEGARRAIQAAMGLSSLPTAAQRQNQKSGVALERIESQQSRGSYHFIDNYDRFLQRMGTIMNGLLDKVYDTPREVGMRKEDETYEVQQIDGLGEGEHGVTISTGPSFDSQREEAQKFTESFVQNPQVMGMALQAPDSAAAKVVSLGIKMLRLGPLGDQISEAIHPPEANPEDIPPEVMAQMQKMQQALKAMNAYAEAVESENKQLKDEREKTLMETQSRERIAAEDNVTKMQIEQMKIDSVQGMKVVDIGIHSLHKKIDVLNAQAQQDATQVHQQSMAAEARVAEAEAQQQAATETQQ